ncbi:MAG: hypothetical protein GY851_05310 [bacterium]|nr:hypothetical protein [bacterium]
MPKPRRKRRREPKFPKLSFDSDKLGLLAAAALAFVVMALCFYGDVTFSMVVYRVAVTFSVTYFVVHVSVRLVRLILANELERLIEAKILAEEAAEAAKVAEEAAEAAGELE